MRRPRILLSRAAALLAAGGLAATAAACTSAVPAGGQAGPPTTTPRVTSSRPASSSLSATPAGHRHHHADHHAHRMAPATPSRSRAVPPVSPSPPATATVPTATPTTTAPVTPPPSGRVTVVLNPGHNGGNARHPEEVNRLVPAGYGRTKACDTTGTNTDAGYPEHAFNWDVSLRVARILRAHGIRVMLTRHSDHGVGPCVNRRAAIGNHPWVAAVVSIHADGGPADGQGFHVNQDSRRPQGATRRVARESRQLGTAIHNALTGSSGLAPSTYIGSNGYYYRDDLAGLDLARRPATFLELGNMRNAHDAALQSSASGRQRIAAAVAAGILAYLGRS